MNKEQTRDFFSVPIRRTRWTSFWIGVGAVVVAFALAALLAAALAGLFVLLKVNFGGTVIIIVFGVLWFGLFFLSYPLQRRYARGCVAKNFLAAIGRTHQSDFTSISWV